jgi:hypothetical protein
VTLEGAKANKDWPLPQNEQNITLKPTSLSDDIPERYIDSSCKLQSINIFYYAENAERNG